MLLHRGVLHLQRDVRRADVIKLHTAYEFVAQSLCGHEPAHRAPWWLSLRSPLGRSLCAKKIGA